VYVKVEFSRILTNSSTRTDGPEPGQETIPVQRVKHYTGDVATLMVASFFKRRGLVLSGKKTAGRSPAAKKKSAAKKIVAKKKSADLWIAPKPTSGKGATMRKWSEQPTAPAGSRLLELADIALGLKKPDNFRKRRSGVLRPKP
jgi:hypothetical protein